MAHFRGKLSSENEAWDFDQGNVTCTHGNFKNHSLVWEKNQLLVDGTRSMGRGAFDPANGLLCFYFPSVKNPNEEERFCAYKVAHSPTRVQFQCQEMLWLEKIDWEFDKEAKKLSLVTPSEGYVDMPEGQVREWSVLGDMPLLVGFLLGIFARLQVLYNLRVEFLSRSAERCNRFVGPLKTKQPRLCAGCAEFNQCVVCSNPPQYEGVLCKSCSAIYSSYCSKCNLPLDGSTTLGLLCAGHGLGKLAESCCRKVY